MMELLLGLFGCFSALGMLGPQLYRIWRRKSSQDLSKPSAAIGASTQAVWLVYACTLDAPALIATNITWTVLLFANVGLVWKYYLPQEEPWTESLSS